jgi:hypothetical protein
MLFNSFYLVIITTFITFLSITFILDGFKISDVKIIRYSQYFVLCLISLYLYFKFFSLPSVYASEKTPPIDPVLSNVNIKITKDAVGSISDGLVTIGSNNRLGATVGATAAAVASVIKTAPIPPIQKVGYVSNIQLFKLLLSNPSSSAGINSPLELNESLLSNSNYVEDLLYSMLTLNVCTLLLFIFFLLSMINKIIFLNGINSNFIDKILPAVYSEKVKSIILSTYKFYSKSNMIYIVFLIIVILISSLASIYFNYELINNFEQISKDYLSFISRENENELIGPPTPLK